MDYSNMSPQEVKKLIRTGEIDYQTSGMCNGYAQANLCILPKDYAFDFLLFCTRNPKPCPILEVGDVGSKQFKTMASEGDVCKDFPKYRIWRNGVLEKEVTDITDYWQDDFVYFLIGCSFSFESELLEADIPVRHIEENKNVPMFNTNIKLQPSGKFHGNMVVSMRPIPNDLVVKAVNVPAAMPRELSRISSISKTPTWESCCTVSNSITMPISIAADTARLCFACVFHGSNSASGENSSALPNMLAKK